jgi:hypothetical protein
MPDQSEITKAVQEIVRGRQEHLERTSKRLDAAGKLEHYHRILEAEFLGREIEKALKRRER